ncbi:hypothetical protein ACQE3E_20585 [Methylomonas sp. MED-D]|uniref:Uncharacterized protein n=1 Tax=Methylomonas koyamae TaxID=702114 RepID=A0A177N9Y2_9GAMM|nr:MULTISPECIES: hypothetical protein [Methylomonas]MDT4332156.1 hypothetical protein [Methylomonas sp. MV1]OAI14695.1 hypothetical protein A1355_12095 [Methylomonas koyamae]OHX35515.1 hypothetical protein BJL95_14850 [Methylomonas sp. LWB]
MSFQKMFVAFALFFSLLGFTGSTFAKEVKKPIPEILKEVDVKIQAALDALPSGNAQEIATHIKDASEIASELSANYKFEFERDKVVLKLKKSRELVKKSDFAGAEQELKTAKEGFANLPKYQ